METMTVLRRRFDMLRGRCPFRALPTIEEVGLMLGRGTVLARMVMTRSGEECLAVEADQERYLALLSATYGWQVDHSITKQINRASAKWQCGDKAGAHIELAFARFPRPRSDEDAFHLFLADDLLSKGMTPRRLARELGFDEALLKYDPSQPRVPAGSGRDSGRWGSAAGNLGEGPSSSVVASPDNAPASPARSTAEPKVSEHNEVSQNNIVPSGYRSTPRGDQVQGKQSLIQQSVVSVTNCGLAFRQCVQAFMASGTPPVRNCTAALAVCRSSGLPTIFGPGLVGQD